MKLTEIDRNDSKPILVESITHLDDLKVDKFLQTIKNLKNYSVTEKVDGCNLHVGLDMGGRLYTTRAHKGGDIHRTLESWGDRFVDAPFKSAHMALTNVSDLLKENGLNEGDVVEIEVLFGNKPNAIPYNPNQIIFLRSIEGEPNIEQLSNVLEGQTTTINVKNIPITQDGRSIQLTEQQQTWTFSKVHEYQVDFEQLEENIQQTVYNMEKFLYSPSNFVVNQRNIANNELLRLRTSIKNKHDKTNTQNVFETFKQEIKDILLDCLVRHQTSKLGPSDGWIEGVVLRRNTNEGVEQIKLVDKDIFTAVNSFNHQVRTFVLEKHRSTKTPRENAGIRGNLLRDMATIIGHPELGTHQAKRYMESFDENLHESDQNIEQFKIDCLKLLEKNQIILERTLNTYNQQYDNKQFVDSVGRIHKYDNAIHNRTLQVFAEMFGQIDNWKNVVSQAKTNKDLMEIVYGR